MNQGNLEKQSLTHHMVRGQNTRHDICEFFSEHILTQREPIQPQIMIRQLSRNIIIPRKIENQNVHIPIITLQLPD